MRAMVVIGKEIERQPPYNAGLYKDSNAYYSRNGRFKNEKQLHQSLNFILRPAAVAPLHYL